MSTHKAKGYVYDHPRPAVAADIAVFTLIDGVLNLLLIQRGLAPFAREWALPGGFLGERETLDECARRELFEEAGVDAPLLRHFANFSDPGRDPRGRTVSVAYFALMPAPALAPRAGSDAAKVRWARLAALPPLAFDHAKIIEAAVAALRRAAADFELLFCLLPTHFTMSQLREAHEAVLDRPADRRNFASRALASGRLRDTRERARGAHRPAALFIAS